MAPSNSRSGARAWHLGIWLGLAPLLAFGFGASALADRPAFAGWALALGALYVWTLRRALSWSPGKRQAILALFAALALATFSVVLRRHAEALDLGIRAFAAPLARFPLAEPRTYDALAVFLGAAGAVALIAAERKESA